MLCPYLRLILKTSSVFILSPEVHWHVKTSRTHWSPICLICMECSCSGYICQTSHVEELIRHVCNLQETSFYLIPKQFSSSVCTSSGLCPCVFCAVKQWCYWHAVTGGNFNRLMAGETLQMTSRNRRSVRQGCPGGILVFAVSYL